MLILFYFQIIIRYAPKYEDTNTFTSPIYKTSEQVNTTLSIDEDLVETKVYPAPSQFHPISDWAVGIISLIFIVIIMLLLVMSVTKPNPVNIINTGPNVGCVEEGRNADTFAIEVVDKKLKGSAMSIEALVTDVIRI